MKASPQRRQPSQRKVECIRFGVHKSPFSIIATMEVFNTVEECPNCHRKMRLLWDAKQGIAFWRCDDCKATVFDPDMLATIRQLQFASASSASSAVKGGEPCR